MSNHELKQKKKKKKKKKEIKKEQHGWINTELKSLYQHFLLILYIFN